MKPLPRLSLAAQTAAHLRAGLRAGQWGGLLPGVIPLSVELQVSPPTVRAALRQLEAEGFLKTRGLGRCRRVADGPPKADRRRPRRVGVLLHERMVDENPGRQSALAQLQHEIEQAGHVCFFSRPCMAGLRHEPERIAAYFAEIQADAWVVLSPRPQVLAWLATQPVPAFSLGALGGDNALAGALVDGQPSIAAATRRLLALGHQRLVFIGQSGVRAPRPRTKAEAFIGELKAAGLRWSHGYNLPEWEETPAGFRALLTGLFSATPPTALLIDETPRVMATLAFLAERGLRVPEQVSLVAMQADSSLTWCHPVIAQLRWDTRPLVRRVVRWVVALDNGKPDLEQSVFPSEFVDGGSIGPVWKE